MKRRAILISLLFSVFGLGMKRSSNQERIVHWPKSQQQQDRILAEQWESHYRIVQVFENETAGFEFVV